MKVAVIGEGWVGRSMVKLFPDAHVHDEPKIAAKKAIEQSRKVVNKADVAFVCVPTPNPKNGALDISIVEEVIKWCESNLIVIRSTVNPGTSDKLAKKYRRRVVHQPEYLGETPDHPMLDPSFRPFMIIGGNPWNRRQLIDLYTSVYNANINIRQVSNYEAEVIKLSENRAIAFKVAQCQELFDACEAASVDYYTIRQAVYGDDPRFDLWFSFVYPDNRGMNSKCIPKDVYAWAAWAESVGIEPQITDAILEKNKDWIAK